MPWLLLRRASITPEGLVRQPALLLSFDEQRDQFGGRQESHPVVVLAAGHPVGGHRRRAYPWRCCMNTRCEWGGVARTSRDPPQEPHYGDEVEGSSQV